MEERKEGTKRWRKDSREGKRDKKKRGERIDGWKEREEEMNAVKESGRGK